MKEAPHESHCRPSYSSCSRASGTTHIVLTIRRSDLEVCNSATSILPLLPQLHIVLQGGKAGGVSIHGGHRPILVLPEALFPPRGALLVVGLNVEVCEESNQRNHVSNLEIQPTERERTRPDDPTAGLDDCQHKLKQLPLSDVLLPPKVRTHGRDGRQTIVRVHEDMDEAVQCGTKIRVATGDPVHDKPPDVQHGGVVVHVQDRDLVVVLAQDEEEGVHELDEFGEVVPPEDFDDLHICFSRAACALTEEVVIVFPYSCH